MNENKSFVRCLNPSRWALFGAMMGVLLSALPAQAGQFFGYEHAVEMARRKVAQPYVELPASVPRPLADLDSQSYYGRIYYRPEKALWAGTGLPFQAQLFHPGHYYTRLVKINVIDEKGVRQLPFDRELFQYLDPVLRDAVPPAFGYAGVRIHSPLNVPGRFDDLIAFLGGTYFRALGKDQHYGLSARGVALDTAEPGGEEFPHFTEFWLIKPRTLRPWRSLPCRKVRAWWGRTVSWCGRGWIRKSTAKWPCFFAMPCPRSGSRR